MRTRTRVRKQQPAFCCHCGTPYENPQPGQLEFRCHAPGCGHTEYLNATGVARLIVPHSGGIIAVRRDIYPAIGKWELPGGHIMDGETWEEAAARECEEEACVHVDNPERSIGPHHFGTSPGTSHVVLFGIIRPGSSVSVRPFEPNREASAREVITRDGWDSIKSQFAFPLHRIAIDLYFAWP